MKADRELIELAWKPSPIIQTDAKVNSQEGGETGSHDKAKRAKAARRTTIGGRHTSSLTKPLDRTRDG